MIRAEAYVWCLLLLQLPQPCFLVYKVVAFCVHTDHRKALTGIWIMWASSYEYCKLILIHYVYSQAGTTGLTIKCLFQCREQPKYMYAYSANNFSKFASLACWIVFFWIGKGQRPHAYSRISFYNSLIVT